MTQPQPPDRSHTSHSHSLAQPPSYAPRSTASAPSKTEAVQPRFTDFLRSVITPRQWRYALSVLAVTVASGLLFGFSASNARDHAEHDGDLVSLVRQRQTIVTSLEEQMSGVQAQVSRHLEQELGTVNDLLNERRGVTYTQVLGPGVTVTLNDAPPGPLPENAKPDDLVIHQQDIEDVMNALWSGGAEAMTVQDVRITSRTVVRCIGNVILIDGTSYSPPYRISAIGDPAALSEAVHSNPQIINYKAYVALYGLGWKFEINDHLDLPAATPDAAVKYAQVMEKHG